MNMWDRADREPVVQGAGLPLAGIRVVSVSAFMAGPFAAMQLADLGADVVKIESTAEGDPVRGIGPFEGGQGGAFLRLNRNSKSLSVDLRSDRGVDIARSLAAKADILIQNYRPGAIERLGLGYSTLLEVNPGLIYASISGWGSEGPLASLPGLDIMAQARSGLMSITGSEGGEPVKAGVPIADLAAGLYAAMGCLAALQSRQRTGAGQHIEVNLLESVMSFMVWEAARYYGSGECGRAHGSAHQAAAPYQAVRAADGWLTVGAVTDKTWGAFCEVIGQRHLLDHPDYLTAHLRYLNRRALVAAIEDAISRWTVDDLLTALNAAGVPCAPINSTGQALESEHLAAARFQWKSLDEDGVEVVQLGTPIHLDSAKRREGTPGPRLGQHTVSVLRSIGYKEVEIAALMRDGVVKAPTTTENRPGGESIGDR